MILKHFHKRIVRKMAILTQNTAINVAKNDHNMMFQEKRQFVRKNGPK
jgi:hypothetical protein